MPHLMHNLEVMSPTGLDFYNDDPHKIIKIISSELFDPKVWSFSLGCFAELFSQALLPQLDDHQSCRSFHGKPLGAYNPRTDLFLVMIWPNVFLTFSTLGNTQIPNVWLPLLC